MATPDTLITHAASAIDTYVTRATAAAVVEVLEDSTFFASIPGLDGVWGSGESRTAALDELRSALEGWIVVSLRHGFAIPALPNAA